MAAALKIFSLLCLVLLTSAYKLDLCDIKPPIMHSFELQKLDGTWYEYAHYPNLVQSFLYKDKCISYLVQPQGKQATTIRTFYNETSGKKEEITGSFSTVDSKPGILNINFPSVPFEVGLSVVDAKYDDYFIVYGCDTLWYFRIELAWVFTRQRELSQPQKDSLLKLLDLYKLDTSRLEYVNQSSC